MPRNASLSSHGPRRCTLNLKKHGLALCFFGEGLLTALLRLRLKSRQFRADSVRSYRVKSKTIQVCVSGPRVSSAALSISICSAVSLIKVSPKTSIVILRRSVPIREFGTWRRSRNTKAVHDGVSKGTDLLLPKLLHSFRVEIFSRLDQLRQRHEVPSYFRAAKKETCLCSD
jgi:hypothetical protein